MRLIILVLLLALTACQIPDTYAVETPFCPWPPPPLSDTLSALIPLGCPFRLDDSTVVWPFPSEYRP